MTHGRIAGANAGQQRIHPRGRGSQIRVGVGPVPEPSGDVCRGEEDPEHVVRAGDGDVAGRRYRTKRRQRVPPVVAQEFILAGPQGFERGNRDEHAAIPGALRHDRLQKSAIVGNVFEDVHQQHDRAVDRVGKVPAVLNHAAGYPRVLNLAHLRVVKIHPDDAADAVVETIDESLGERTGSGPDVDDVEPARVRGQDRRHVAIQRPPLGSIVPVRSRVNAAAGLLEIH